MPNHQQGCCAGYHHAQQRQRQPRRFPKDDPVRTSTIFKNGTSITTEHTVEKRPWKKRSIE